MGSPNPKDANNIPALAPPVGIQSNFVNPYSLNSLFIVTAVLCLTFATFALIIRLAAAKCHRGAAKTLRLEEYLCIVSWLGLIETCTLTVLEIQQGLGRHQWDMPKANMEPLLKLFYINRIFYSPTILAAKLTILLQLMRIFTPTKRGLVFWLYQSLIWLNTIFYLANVIAVIFQCTPISKAWDKGINGKCINPNLNLMVTGSVNVISDLLILLLPLWTIWHLRLPISKKLGVSVAFAAGAFANLAGIMRLYYSVHIIHAKDLSFIRLQHGMWTIAEISAAIICSSLPLVPKFLELFRRKTYASIGPASSSSQRTTQDGSQERSKTQEVELKAWDEGSGKGMMDSRGDKKRQVVVTTTYIEEN